MMLSAVMMVKNEAAMLSVNLAYHRAMGIKDFWVVDNGSTDGTTELLEHERRVHGDVRWTSEPDRFSQSELTTEIAAEAFAAGSDWILPIDADEFWWIADGSLQGALRSARGVGAIICEVDNFVQHRSVIDELASSLKTMTYSAVPLGTIETAQELVEAGKIAFVESAYPPKQILRASRRLVIGIGNHSAGNVAGSRERSSTIRVLHAPIRSPAALHRRAALGRQFEEHCPDPGLGWHVRRWARLESEGTLGVDWDANSQRFGRLRLRGSSHGLKRDLRLRNGVLPFIDEASPKRSRVSTVGR